MATQLGQLTKNLWTRILEKGEIPEIPNFKNNAPLIQYFTIVFTQFNIINTFFKLKQCLCSISVLHINVLCLYNFTGVV